MSESPRLFLSYSHADEDWVSSLVEDLKSHSVDIWYSKAELKPGELWAESLASALRDSECMIFVISNASLGSEWMFAELGAAMAGRKKIIPVVPSSALPARTPEVLSRLQAIITPSAEEASKRIRDALGTKTAQVAS